MAIRNKSARQGEFVPPGSEPGLTLKFAWRDVEGDKAIGEIADLRFDYPDINHAGWHTFTNRPSRQVGVRVNMEDKEFIFPDIVVIERPGDEVAMVGEVETHRTLRETDEAQLIAKWQAFAGVGPFYLFVPLMDVDIARKILKRHKLKLAGLRGWRIIAGQDIADVSDV